MVIEVPDFVIDANPALACCFEVTDGDRRWSSVLPFRKTRRGTTHQTATERVGNVAIRP
jgi:hypothetical protein